MGGSNSKLLQVKDPVPSDIDIAQAIEPTHIRYIAQSLGLRHDEFDLYGTHKAKVRLFSFPIRLSLTVQRRSRRAGHRAAAHTSD